MEKMQSWFDDLVVSLKNNVDENTGISILEGCGRLCAKKGMLKNVIAFKESMGSIYDPNKILEEVNKKIWSGKLKIQGNIVYLTYEKCYCQIVNTGLIKSPYFCNCSRGWVKEVFSTLLEKEVEVELLKSVSKGDGICEFAIRF